MSDFPEPNAIVRALNRTVRRVVRYVGFRGAGLIIFGFAFIGIGIGVVGNPQTDSGLLHTQFPVWFRVGLWCVTGAGAVACAVICPRFQAAGYGLLFLAPGQRWLSYSIELIRDLLEHVHGALALIALLALQVAFLAAVSVATSGEPKRTRRKAAIWAFLLVAVLAVLVAGIVISGMLSLRWVGACAVYSLFCSLIALVSAWPEPAPAPRIATGDR